MASGEGSQLDHIVSFLAHVDQQREVLELLRQRERYLVDLQLRKRTNQRISSPLKFWVANLLNYGGMSITRHRKEMAVNGGFSNNYHVLSQL